MSHDDAQREAADRFAQTVEYMARVTRTDLRDILKAVDAMRDAIRVSPDVRPRLRPLTGRLSDVRREALIVAQAIKRLCDVIQRDHDGH